MKTRTIKPARLLKADIPIFFRLVCLTAALSAAITLSGCKKANNASSSAGTTAATAAAQTTQVSETTEAVTTGTTVAIPEGVPTEGWCNASSMHIRSGPGMDYGAIGGLKAGERVAIVGREGDWYKIVFKDGYGYVNAQHIQATEFIPTEPAATATTAGQ